MSTQYLIKQMYWSHLLEWFRFLPHIDFVCVSVHQQGKHGENSPILETDGSAQIIEVKPQVTPKNVDNREASRSSKTGPSGMIIRGMTFYKSEPDPMVADDGEHGENCK